MSGHTNKYAIGTIITQQDYGVIVHTELGQFDYVLHIVSKDMMKNNDNKNKKMTINRCNLHSVPL